MFYLYKTPYTLVDLHAQVRPRMSKNIKFSLINLVRKKFPTKKKHVRQTAKIYKFFRLRHSLEFSVQNSEST